MITNFSNFVNEFLGSSLALPANGLGGSRATSLLVAHFALQNTKFGSEKGKVQNPARIPPQTPPAGGKKAEAGQFHSPRKIVCPAESKLVFRVFIKKCSNINQKTPPVRKCLGWLALCEGTPVDFKRKWEFFIFQNEVRYLKNFTHLLSLLTAL